MLHLKRKRGKATSFFRCFVVFWSGLGVRVIISSLQFVIVISILIDVNECIVTDMSPCSVQCVNTFGSYHCTCPAGYQLGADGRSCEYKVVLKVIVKVVMKVVHLQGHVESQMF